MENLKIIEHEAQRVLTTKQLAEAYETDTKNIQMNFNNNKQRFEENRDYYCLKGNELKAFKRVSNDIGDPSIKFASVLYLWTERGTNRHSKILDTDKAWQQFDILEETYFKVKNNTLQIPTTEREILMMAVRVQEETAQRVDKLEANVKDIKENQAITPGEYNYINKKVRSRIKEIKNIRDLNLTKEQNSYLFKSISRDLAVFTQVHTRSQIRVKDFEKAVQFINDWEPSYTDLQIVNQLSMF